MKMYNKILSNVCQCQIQLSGGQGAITNILMSKTYILPCLKIVIRQYFYFYFVDIFW